MFYWGWSVKVARLDAKGTREITCTDNGCSEVGGRIVRQLTASSVDCNTKD
jgi:hypothetical protein